MGFASPGEVEVTGDLGCGREGEGGCLIGVWGRGETELARGGLVWGALLLGVCRPGCDMVFGAI